MNRMGLANHLYKVHKKFHQARSITATPGERRSKTLLKNSKNHKNK